MSLVSHQLEAFGAVAKFLHFAKAAKSLHITQSALSQRIQNLEGAMGVALFVRDKRSVTLTEAGHRLLRYCQVKNALEEEMLSELSDSGNHSGELVGTLRVAGYSSVMRSVILPGLAPFLRQHPKIQLECLTCELISLPAVFERGECDWLVLDRKLARAGVENLCLGKEENILVESTRFSTRAGVYLDHDADDATTALLLQANGKSGPQTSRAFLDEVYAILDGVALGLGRAVLPKHLTKGHAGVRAVSGYKSVKNDVIVHYKSQPYYTRLQQALLQAFAAIKM